MEYVTIKVKPDVLLEKAEAVLEKTSEISQCFEKMESAVKRSEGYWQGEAAQVHRESYQDYKNEIQEILKRFHENAKDLKGIAQNYITVESENEAEVLTLPSDVIV